MKTLRFLAIIISALTIASFCHSENFTSDFNANMQRYFGSGQGNPRSYIDTNNRISMESYIIANPYPNNYPGGSSQEYNHPRSPNQQYFQPADGSLNNGTYDVTNKTAKTPLHSYNNVIIVDGTVTTPTLNSQAKYVDKENKEYNMIGSVHIPSEDESDMSTYYFFGQINDQKNKDQVNENINVASQTYNSQGE